MNASASRYCKCMYFAANALARRMEKMAEASWKKVKLSPSHGYLLMMVVDFPGIQPSALVEELLLAPSTITRLIEKLEEKKLVTRKTEGKITNIYPTRKAKVLRPLLQTCLVEFYENYCAVLGKEESANLVHAMNDLTDKL